jgi:hypothetical protein
MATPLPPYLTDEEIFEICRPRRQGAAQIRYLKSIGVKLERRADGTPLVWRRDVERPAEPAATAGIVPAANQPKWSRHA